MDQDSFRQLLQTPRLSSGSAASRASQVTSVVSKSQPKIIEGSKNSFKPRKVKKESDSAHSKYRDRAAERRIGEGNDYAQVEALLEDFEKRAAGAEDKDAVDRQRRYLGGDSDHSILVKGLDVALAQQNKARAAQSTEGDDALEQAFIDASSQSNVTAAATRRTREDLIKQLKQNMHSAHGREAEDESKVLEEATKASKFKPIGFKPIGVERGPGKKEKKAKEKDADGRKRKKRKMGEGGLDVVANPEDGDLEKSLPVTQPFTPRQLEPETDPDFDIFAGVGDYEGIGSDDDNDVVAGGHELDASVSADNMRTATADAAKGKWFDLEDQERARASSTPKETSIARPDTPTHTQPRDAEDLLAEQPTRLVPLASSAMPSVQDFLAMEQAAQALEKRRKRKEKKK